jgi:Na+/H+-dicarboxylate symporter
MAFLEALLDVGFVSLLYIVEIVLSIAGGVLVLFASYAIRLRAKGVNVRAFAKKLLPLLRENVAINSSIDAVPYNIRYCTRNFGMSREKLSSNLPILAQLSLDGNCFILMYIAMICIFMSVSSVPWPNVVGIAALVLFLELGAPNQPGGILIGTMIVITYLNLPDMLRMAIYLEMFLGSAQNIINVMSNIVAMAEDEGVRLD